VQTGNFLTTILKPHRRVGQALYGVVMESYDRQQLQTDLGHIDLKEQTAEGGIGGRWSRLKPKRLVQRSAKA
jgi:hypothetical protein